MRPEILFPAFVSVDTLNGVGRRTARLIEKLAGPQLVDLYWHLPKGLIDRRFSPFISEVVNGKIATLIVTVKGHTPPRNKRLPYKVLCSDKTGYLTLVFFNANKDYLRRILPENTVRVISGEVRFYNGSIQMAHPDHIGKPADLDEIRTIEPVYGLTAGLSQKNIKKFVSSALKNLPDLPPWLDEAFVDQRGWSSWRKSVLEAHAPQAQSYLDPSHPTRARLAYDELLAAQLSLAIMRKNLRAVRGYSISGNGTLRQQLLRNLPFTLTNSQAKALREIYKDMALSVRMLRLIQGDVGSGKTVVAFLSMLNAIESGYQSTLMVPTEILARQHYSVLAPLACNLGIKIGILTGKQTGEVRMAVLSKLEKGEIQILIGTHAVFQKEVVFKKLGFAVIDEQHRFGVQQRIALMAKASEKRPDLLLMSATPIPRTLTMTAYGDMDVSQLNEKPSGRKPIHTSAVPLERFDDVVEAVVRAVEKGEQVYWICPLVEESEALVATTVEDRYRYLSAKFGTNVALVHGKMGSNRRNDEMSRFASGKALILVATTVIEVGVDIQNASIMVIEHADRFGLAQLHQLRGRIGRGAKRGYCVLLYSSPMSDHARERINILKETEDGFLIAEKDLHLRGGGEILGTRQSGLPYFRLVDPIIHEELIEIARDDAKNALEKDPALISERGLALRNLLYLFQRDSLVDLLQPV